MERAPSRLYFAAGFPTGRTACCLGGTPRIGSERGARCSSGSPTSPKRYRGRSDCLVVVNRRARVQGWLKTNEHRASPPATVAGRDDRASTGHCLYPFSQENGRPLFSAQSDNGDRMVFQGKTNAVPVQAFEGHAEIAQSDGDAHAVGFRQQPLVLRVILGEHFLGRQ